MDISTLMRITSQQSSTISTFRNNPFPRRPWLTDTGAAAAATGSSGVKGIVAGIILFFLRLFFCHTCRFSYNFDMYVYVYINALKHI